MEIWKNIPNYDGLYQISSYGRVKSLKYGKERILYQHLTSKGYYIVALSKNGKVNRFLVHRLVAESFIDNPDGKLEIDHINGDKTDNNVKNLHWVTRIENLHNPITYSKFFKPLSEDTKKKLSQIAKNRLNHSPNKPL